MLGGSVPPVGNSDRQGHRFYRPIALMHCNRTSLRPGNSLICPLARSPSSTGDWSLSQRLFIACSFAMVCAGIGIATLWAQEAQEFWRQEALRARPPMQPSVPQTSVGATSDWRARKLRVGDNDPKSLFGRSEKTAWRGATSAGSNPRGTGTALGRAMAITFPSPAEALMRRIRTPAKRRVLVHGWRFMSVRAPTGLRMPYRSRESLTRPFQPPFPIGPNSPKLVPARSRESAASPLYSRTLRLCKETSS